MSVSKWAYIPSRCDGDFCPGDCDCCSKTEDNIAEEPPKVGNMKNLFGDEYSEIPKKRKPPDKAKRAWENAFQRWSNKVSQEGNTPLGCCGYGSICDYCKDNHIGRPCVRALNAKAREKRIEIDYNDRDFEKWFYL